MRIISGKYKGRVLRIPSKFKARPTTDYAKTGLFNILENHFEFTEVSLLDLFSGTGSIGFECASRGSADVVMVEKNSLHYLFITQTIELLGMKGVHAVRGDVFHFIRSSNRTFDLVFADPPYNMQGIEKLPEQIFESRLVAPGGWFVLEHSAFIDFRGHPHLREHRHYGNVHFSFFE